MGVRGAAGAGGGANENLLEKLDDKKDQKYSDYIRLEKMRNFQRLPRLVGNRSSVQFTCPSCKREGRTATHYELTGT